MSTLSILALIAALFLLAAAVPGPNWIVITRQALAGDRRRAVLAASGVTIGSTLWMLTAMTGAAAALTRPHALLTVLRLAGATYLVWSSVLVWRSATRSSDEAAAPGYAGESTRFPLVDGLLTSLTNPKSALFWTSVFTSTLPANPPVLLCLTAGLVVTSLAVTWYLGMAVVFTSAKIRPVVGRFRYPLQRIGALAQMGLGLRLAISVTKA